MIPVDNDSILIQCGRASFTKIHPFIQLAKIPLPYEGSLHIKTKQTSRTKVGIDMLPIRHR